MKRTSFIIALSLIIFPLTVGSAEWTKESNEFTFPATGIINEQAARLSGALGCQFNANKSILVFSLPVTKEDANLSIYNLSGVQIGAQKIKAGSRTVKWDASVKNMPVGIYVAILRNETIESKVQFSTIH